MLLIIEFAAKGILNELESLLEDVAGAIQTANECLAPFWDKDGGSGLDLQDTKDKVGFNVVVTFQFRMST